MHEKCYFSIIKTEESDDEKKKKHFKSFFFQIWMKIANEWILCCSDRTTTTKRIKKNTKRTWRIKQQHNTEKKTTMKLEQKLFRDEIFNETNNQLHDYDLRFTMIFCSSSWIYFRLLSTALHSLCVVFM